MERGARRVRIPSPLDQYDVDLEECYDEDWRDEKVQIGIQSECVHSTSPALPAEPLPTKQAASASLVSMSSMATDGSALRNDETEMNGLTPSQPPKPRSSVNVQRI